MRNISEIEMLFLKMDFQELLNKYSPFIKRNFFSIALGLLGLIFLSYGLIVLIGGSKSSSDEIVFEAGNEQVLNSSKNAKITVDIEGALLKPGVYSLSSDARLQDAIIAGGGLSEAADRIWISKNLNLAQKLTDGAKIYIPKTGENIKGSMNLGAGIELGLEGKININSATIKELDSLPGIGMVTAQKIIDNRPYSMIEDLLSKKVVSEKVFGEIKEKITVY